MQRVLAAVVVALLSGVPARAQEAEPRPARVEDARLSVTPLVGVRSALLSGRTTPVIVAGALRSTAVRLEPERGAGGVGGVEVELRLAGRLGATGALLFSNPDPFLLTTQAESRTVTQLRVSGPSLRVARAGLSYRLPDVDAEYAHVLPAGYLLVGPARVRQDFRESVLELPGEEPLDSWAVHLGYRALFPIGSPRLLLQASLEDYVPFWNRRRERERVERILSLEPGTVLSADLGYDRHHVLMLHLGLALRL